MEPDNPYAAPTSGVGDPEQPDFSTLNAVARGQRIVLVALLLSIFAAFGAGLIGAVAALAIFVVTAIASIYGLLVLAAGLGYSYVTRFVLLVGLLVPTLNWLIMLMLCNTANKRLKAAGYKLGLMGADPR